MFELVAFGIRMIMIPLPESGGNHQYHNAVSFLSQGHILIQESDFSRNALSQIKNCLHEKKKAQKIDINISEKPLKIIFDVLASYSTLTRA